MGTNESRIILADMSQVVPARTAVMLTETFGHYDQIAIRVTCRFDIAPLNPEGIIVLSGVTP